MSGLTPPFPSVEDVPSSPGNLEDRGSESRTPFAAASPVTPSPRTGSSQSTSAHDWESFPWSQSPDLTISERKGRPESWIWQHGYDLQEIKDETRHRWVCRECVKKKDPKITAHLASATFNIESHLGNQHNIHGGKLQPRLGKRTIDQMFSLASTETPDVDFQFRNRLKKQFDKAVFQRNWCDGLWRPTNPSDATNAHISQDAIRRRVADEYHFFRLHIVRALRQSPSAVHIAFDGWTSRNRHPLFGVVAFFLDQSFRPRKIVLGLPNLTDRHTGENIADSVRDIIEAFELGKEKIGYFTLDNASNNGKPMVHLAQHFQWTNVMSRRIRCFGHVIHLVARAMLLGKDDADGAIEYDLDTDALEMWAKRGPIGKLHSLVVWRNRSNRVTEMLRDVQRQDTDKKWPGSLDVVVDNNTRWLSQYYMMGRALQLRPCIEVIISDIQYEASKPRRKGSRQHSLPPCLEADGLLTEDDWKTIGYYHSILRQFEACVKDLEGDGKQRIRKGGKEAAYGLMQDICPAYELSIGHLEEAKLDADRTPEPAHFRTNINLAWAKLNKYYSTIDQSPAYYAATVLHPAIRWDFLRRAYRERPEWIEKAQQLLSDIWQEYKIKRAKEAEEAVDTFSSYLDSFKSTAMEISRESTGDELDRWLHLADPVEKDCDPFLYWFNKRFDYPRLTRMAIDILSVPPMAAECERVFSSCGNMVSAKRCRLQAETIAITQTVRSWLRAGLLDDYDGLLKDLVEVEFNET
ncbi:transposase-like protein [Beauveria bassiana ARSEF 2860]|uniref:Transposase-like protein n=1 Tax=Beauveria bassiana (strain ARSEF 2860) TaxID=655819 RepID=J4KL34_BEAB2|nr:transposase-like protein [Beauveria bassiana ARSEF 2860]EJP61509.1 transposase-like protein [Beauveria bassiana ARSEF 2860]